jgi:hypothetical protein
MLKKCVSPWKEKWIFVLVKGKGDGKKVIVLPAYHIIGLLLKVNSIHWKDVVKFIMCFKENIVSTLTQFGIKC